MSEDDGARKEIVKAAGVELAKEVYSDALKKPLQAVGQILYGVIVPFAALANAWSGMWEGFQARMVDRMKEVPEEDIREAPAYLAYQILQTYPFTEEEPELRDAFEQLLASSMNSQTVEHCHPAFVEMLKQMTADEARVMGLFRQVGSIPILEVISSARVDLEPRPVPATPLHMVFRRDDNGSGPRRTLCYLYDPRLVRCITPRPKESPAVQRCIDNLERLGLIAIDMTRFMTDGDPYVPILEGSEYKAYQDQHATGPRVLREPRKGYAALTALGVSFLRSCVGPVQYEGPK